MTEQKIIINPLIVKAKSNDLTNQKFGRLTVIKRAEAIISKSGKKRGRWLCKCDCGQYATVLTDSLKSGSTKSCGCYRTESRKNVNKKHGMIGTRLYTEWISMKSRCYYTQNKAYERYGGRGIAICVEWLNSFDAFYEWAIANGYSDDLTIERVDVNGDYCPENCCWIPANEQAKNRRTTLRIVDENGEMVYVMDVADKNGISMSNVVARKSRGWSLEKALSTPLIEQTLKRKVFKIQPETGLILGIYVSIGEASRESGVERSSISRCCLGQRNHAGGYRWKYAN